MRGLAALGLVLFIGASGCNESPVTRQEAKAAADAYFVQLTERAGEEKSDFYAAHIEETAEGWQFQYHLKHDPDRAYGIFVTRSGKTDVNLTPDA